MSFHGTLRPYQAEAVNKMVDRGQMLLGLVMGAGKTPCAISAVEMLHDLEEVDRCLVVVPSALKYQWKAEIEKFSDAKVTVIDGDPKARAACWRVSIGSRYTVVNPESLTRDLNQYKQHSFQAIIVDEASLLLKTRTAKRSKMLKKIANPIFYRYALTGQPIENRPEELFSIMEFVDRDVLGKFDVFDRTFIVRDHFGKPIRYKNLPTMMKSLSDCMIRKTRDDIKDQLPTIIHQLIEVPFDEPGAVIYRRIANDLLQQIQQAVTQHGGGFNLWAHYNSNSGGEAQGQIMSRLTVLRMLCDNPELIRMSADNFADANQPKVGSEYAAAIVANGWMDGVTNTPKLDAVLEYIEDVLSEDPKNKVVLFSFFKSNLKLIQAATEKLTKSVLYTGDQNSQQKDTAKKLFQTDPKCRLFLSSDAGGYGVDLPQANYLISYDLPWSSGKMEQREARIIRLSSEFPHVTLAAFVMRGSIESRQHEMLEQKRKTNEAFVDGKHQDVKGGMDITLGSLSEFLRSTNL